MPSEVLLQMPHDGSFPSSLIVRGVSRDALSRTFLTFFRSANPAALIYRPYPSAALGRKEVRTRKSLKISNLSGGLGSLHAAIHAPSAQFLANRAVHLQK